MLLRRLLTIFLCWFFLTRFFLLVGSFSPQILGFRDHHSHEFMAAVVRGGHPRQQGGRGGRARGGGRGDRGGTPADAEPAQGRANPLGYDWLLWRAGNTNNMSTNSKSKDEDQTVRIFKELVDSPKVDRQIL